MRDTYYNQLTKAGFTAKALAMHGGKYDYSKVVYVNNYTKVCITCPEHGEFWQVPHTHMAGGGCPKCGVESRALKRLLAGGEKFFTEASVIHEGAYDYSRAIYRGSHNKVHIICPIHGGFWQSPTNHLQGKGCPMCKGDKISKIRGEGHEAKLPDLSHVETPNDSKAVPVGTKGDYALVDEEDYERVMEHSWYLTKQGYARNTYIGFMHQFILNPPDGMVIDHKYHNTLDNRKSQLRVCTRQENMCNQKSSRGTSKFKGVSWNKRANKWEAYISSKNKRRLLGYFTNEEEAARAYDEAAKKYHKDFARLNFS